MKKIFNIIILVIFWSIIFAPFYLLLKKSGTSAISFLIASYLVCLLFSVTYKYFWSFQNINNKNVFKFFSVLAVFFFITLFLTNLVFRAYDGYKYLVEADKSVLKGVHYQPDSILGFKPIPLAEEFQKTTGSEISVAYDKNGFRVPLSDKLKINGSNKINLLFLGDSFTFGAGCYAEDTFPFLAAKKTGLSYINAGVSSYGLSQMVILAEKLIPEYKPDYVIVQYSPWLASRSASIYAPLNFVRLPVPYFAQTNNGYVLEPPVYFIDSLGMDTENIKSSYEGKFTRFLFKEALFYYLDEVRHSLKAEFLLTTGQLRRPATNMKEVEIYAYNRIKTVAGKNGATLIILNLGDIEYTKYSHRLFSDSNIHFAEADNDLNNDLKTSSSKDYYREFCFWAFNGNDLVIIDNHPNPKAHLIIAESIIRLINKAQKNK